MTTVDLRRVFHLVNGGTPTSDDANWDGDVQWATPVDLAGHNGDRIASTDRTLTEEGLASGSRAVRAGSLIVSTRAPIGYVAETSVPMAFNQGCRGLEPKHPVDIRYFRYQLGSMAERLQSRGNGSTFVELSSDALAEVPVVVPPLEDQRAIADFLDAETARIDALIAKKQQLIHLLEARWQSVVSDRVWGSTAARTRLKYLTGLPSSGNRDHGSFTDDDSGVPCLRGLNVRSGHLDMANLRYISEEDHARQVQTQLQVGDIVIVRSGLAGAAVRIPPDLQPCNCVDLVVVRRSARVDPRFLEYVINSREAQEQVAQNSAGALLTHFNAIDAGDLLVPDLSIARQQGIAKALDRERERQRSTVTSLATQVALLSEHRQAFITALVAGEMSVQAGP